MTTKRRTKAQRKAQQRAALRQQLVDIYTGACYGNSPEDEEGFVPSVESLPSIVKAVKHHIIGGRLLAERAYLGDDHVLGKYADIEVLTDFLFDNGVRA